MEQNDRLMSAILDIGEAMLEACGEVSRVETSIQLLAQAYGYTHVNVFTIIFSIVVSAQDAEGRVVSHSRRISRWNTDMHRLEQLNALSRRLCAEPAPAEEIIAAVERIRNGPRYPSWLMCVLYLIIPIAMSMFFGANLWEGLASSACGVVLWNVERLGTHLRFKPLVQCFFCSVTVGLCASILVAIFPSLQIGKVIIGNIMLLISGLALTVSLRDMINGDTITGLLGFSYAILRALLIAIGVALVPMLLGGFLP